MKIFQILVISLLLSACIPQAIPSTPTLEATTPQTEIPSSSPTPLFTKTTAPISPEPTEFDFELPPDCSTFDPSIDSGYYHDLSDGACNHPALSPDGSQIAYAVLKVIDTGIIVQEAKLFSVSGGESFPIYTSKCGNLYPEWSSTGFLVISDFAQDVGCEHTIIYHSTKSEIVATLDGAVRRSWREYWSTDKNVFFTLTPDVFGPECSEILSGYDFISNQFIPTIKPITPDTNVYAVIGDPVWSSDNKSLSAVLRDGICSNSESHKCTYGNSYILSIDFSDITPTISYPYYDRALDYSFVKSQNGIVEISSAPSKLINCQDVQVEESK
jgi:hypothetical protein